MSIYIIFFNFMIVSVVVIVSFLTQSIYMSHLSSTSKTPAEEGQRWIRLIGKKGKYLPSLLYCPTWKKKEKLFYQLICSDSNPSDEVISEIALSLTICILEKQGRPEILCELDSTAQICAESHGYIMSLYESFKEISPFICIRMEEEDKYKYTDMLLIHLDGIFANVDLARKVGIENGQPSRLGVFKFRALEDLVASKKAPFLHAAFKFFESMTSALDPRIESRKNGNDTEF